MKKIMIASTLLIATTLAQANIAESTSMTVTELNVTAADLAYAGAVSTVGGAGSGGAQTLKPTQNSGVFEMGMPSSLNDGSFGGSSSSFLGGSDDKVGQVISKARDLIALGESFYTLVQKGKPSNTTTYAPISVVPRDPMTKEYVDPFELESCSMPITRKFKASMKSGVKVVVDFQYMLIYTVNCSYNGTGKFIANAMIQPVSVKTAFGWDFNATMKLNGVMNNGTKAAPVAGAMLTMKYQMNSWTTAFERNDTIYISGRGDIKTY